MFRITGAHTIIYSEKPDADRAFLRDVLGFPHVDAGGGWLIFALPPAEVAVHPADANGAHEFYLMVDDVAEFASAMAARGVACSPPRELRWGLLTQLSLPGGGTLGIYEPRHPRPTSA
ncbi:MAG: extradiol dioxygenase [Acidobacteriota bacterium]|nr:extradiol dioxygenase [Acidobacteriota bacterium]